VRNLAEDQKSAGAEIILHPGERVGVEKSKRNIIKPPQKLKLGVWVYSIYSDSLREFGGVLLRIGQMRHFGEFGGNGFLHQGQQLR